MKNNKVKSSSTNSMMLASVAGLSFIMGFFILLIIGANSWGKHLNDQMKVYVYFDDTLVVNQINNSINQIKKENFINKNDIRYVSKEITAKEFLASSHENYEELLGDVNPFKNLVIVGILNKDLNQKQLISLLEKLKTINGVYEVSYPINIFSSISPRIKLISSIISVIVLILCVWIYMQLSSYIKLQMHSNRTIIKSMQLLGSTNSFIFKPYIINSIIIGFGGSIVGYILINGLIYYTTLQLPEIQNFAFDTYNQIVLLCTSVLFCVLFSTISTYFSLNKYMKISHVNVI